MMEGEEGLASDGEGEDGDEAPAVVGGEDGEMNMEEEMDEFLKFATETLGLTEEQYSRILGERKERGGELAAEASHSGFSSRVELGSASTCHAWS